MPGTWGEGGSKTAGNHNGVAYFGLVLQVLVFGAQVAAYAASLTRPEHRHIDEMHNSPRVAVTSSFAGQAAREAASR